MSKRTRKIQLCLLDSSAKKILRERIASMLEELFNTKQLMKSMKEFYGNSSLALKVLKDLPDVKSVLFIVEMQAQCLLNRDEAISRLKAAGLSHQPSDLQVLPQLIELLFADVFHQRTRARKQRNSPPDVE